MAVVELSHNYPFWNAHGFRPLERRPSIESSKTLVSTAKIDLSEDKLLRRLFEDLRTFYTSGFMQKLGPVVTVRPVYISPLVFEIMSFVLLFEPALQEPKVQEPRRHETKYDALSLIVIVIFHNNVLCDWVTKALSSHEKISEKSLKKLKHMKTDLISYTLALDRVLQLYTFNHHEEQMTTELYEAFNASKKKLKAVIKQMGVEAIQKLIPKESRVSPDHMLCSVIGIQSECGDWLHSMDEETRGHEEDEYWILRYLEDKADQLEDKEGGSAQESSVEDQLVDLGFTCHRASLLAERLRKCGNLLEHQTMLYSAQCYVEEAFKYDILLKDTPRYPYEGRGLESGNWGHALIADRDADDDEDDDDDDDDDVVDYVDCRYGDEAQSRRGTALCDIAQSGKFAPSISDTSLARFQGPDRAMTFYGPDSQRHLEVKVDIINLSSHGDAYQEKDGRKFPPESDEEFLVLSHSTDHKSAQSLMEDGILMARSKQALDFSGHGRSGFYLTEDFDYAMRCARTRTRGAVVVFRVPRSSLQTFHINELNLRNNPQEWREIVMYNRSEGKRRFANRNLMRTYKKSSYVVGPLCNGGFTSNPSQSRTQQMCILSEEMAKMIGNIQNISGVLFL